MGKEEKTNLSLVVLVGIVAAVAIVVLLLNAGAENSLGDVTGQAIKVTKMGSVSSSTNSISPSVNSAQCCDWKDQDGTCTKWVDC